MAAVTFVVGQRIADKDRYRGTIHYIGPVASSKSAETLYAGIAWDDATRGKNDGSVTTATGETIRYFNCVPGAGSFMKLELLNPGVELVFALQEKYMDTSDAPIGDAARAIDSEGGIVGSSGKAIPVYLVGDNKVRQQQKLEKLTHIAMRDMLISSIDTEAMRVRVPNLREIDLRASLITDFKQIAALGRALPNLRVLNIGENRFQPFDDESTAEMLHGAFPNLRTLIVSDTGMTWRETAMLSAAAPLLEELHVANNQLQTFVASPAFLDETHGNIIAEHTSFVDSGLFPNLKSLNLSGNGITSWGQVYALAALRSLCWLLVNDNKLADLWCGEDLPAPLIGPPFPALEQLSLTGNVISSPAYLDGLDSFPGLTNLRLQNTDLQFGSATTLGPSEARQIVVARVPKLLTLNNSEVRSREREDAEKAYTRKMGQEFAEKCGVATVQDVFGPRSVSAEEIAGYIASGGARADASRTTPEGGVVAAATAKGIELASAVVLPEAFRRGGDAGVIRSVKQIDNKSPFFTSPYCLRLVSFGSEPRYVPELDPFGLGSSHPDAAARLQFLYPRYFMLAAKYDLHAAAVKDPTAATTIMSSSVGVTLRSMAGNSCTIEPITRRLPLTMNIGAVKQLAARVFKCDPSLQRLSFRDSTGSYPSLMEDDMKTLAYYAVCDGGEILMEEVDPAEAARQAAEAQRLRDAKVAEQSAVGEALRKAQEQSVSADRRAVTSLATEL